MSYIQAVRKKYEGEAFDEDQIRSDWRKYNAYLEICPSWNLPQYDPEQHLDFEHFQKENESQIIQGFCYLKWNFGIALNEKLMEIFGVFNSLYEIIGLSHEDEYKYRDAVDLSEIGDVIYNALKNFDPLAIKAAQNNFCRQYWDELKKEIPTDRYYAATEVVPQKRAPKVWPKWSLFTPPRYQRLKGVLKYTYKNLVPAAGHFYYFDTEAERDAYVAAQAGTNTIPILIDDLPEMQWRLQDAKRVPTRTPTTTTSAYMVIDKNKWFEVYETKELAEEAIEMSQHRHYLSIVEIPLIMKALL